jgi:putative ABC transport system permease protein
MGVAGLFALACRLPIRRHGVGTAPARAHPGDRRSLIPTVAVTGGVVAALVIGACAGLYPAARASRLSPTEALHTT